MTLRSSSTLRIPHVAEDFAISDLENAAWQNGTKVLIKNYWSGKEAPEGRWVKATLVWTQTAIYARFEASQDEPLMVSDEPDLTKKTKGIWDRDVCEIFIAPDRNVPNKYFEFEIAPTGEWVDVAIELTHERVSDWHYMSGMRSAARIETDKVVMAIRIEWKALGKTPKTGDVWLGNLFRCVGKDPTRGYLSWQATKTKDPSFHVPSKFGEFEFINKSDQANSFS